MGSSEDSVQKRFQLRSVGPPGTQTVENSCHHSLPIWLRSGPSVQFYRSVSILMFNLSFLFPSLWEYFAVDPMGPSPSLLRLLCLGGVSTA